MNDLRCLEHLMGDEQARKEFMAIKRANKEKLWWWVKNHCEVKLNLDSMFDV